MNLIKPAALRAGHRIGIVAPASNIKQDLLDEGCRELEALGFKACYRPGVPSWYRYCPGPRQRRLGEFLEMLRSPDIRAIFCARGGYGSGQLISDVDADLIRENAKIINGSSDITLLLNWVERAGVVAFHGPMVATAIRQGTEGYDRALLLDLLQGKHAVKFPTGSTKVLRSGSGEGRLIGGCLSFVGATPATPQKNPPGGTKLLLEEQDGKPCPLPRTVTPPQQPREMRHSSPRGFCWN